jgi:hypothetical protein
MKILARYIHGSEDSTDLDVLYIVDELPDKAECKRFCSADPSENRNVATVSDGVIASVYKGTVDELNNALLRTYHLHPQTDELLVKRELERCVPLKLVRAVRILLSYMSRTHYRTDVKAALRGTWTDKLNMLDKIDLTTVDFNAFHKGEHNRADILKTYAFQIGQVAGLLHNPQIEVYTKSEIAEKKISEQLKPYLYREDNADLDFLNDCIRIVVELIRSVEYEDIQRENGTYVRFLDSGLTIDLHTEQIVNDIVD